MKAEQYKNKEWLYHEYVILEKSLNQIGKECEVSGSTIMRWMEKYNMPRRTLSESRTGEKHPMYGKFHSEEIKGKISTTLTGRILSKETKDKMSEGKTGKNNPFFGKTLTKEHRDKISISNTGKTHSKETRVKQRAVWTLERRSEMSENNPMKRLEVRAKVSATTSGDKHWNWQDGKSFEPYGLEFNDKLKEQIRERDDYICQECNKTQKESDRKLDIHHIDYDKTNNDPNNLISLCRSCHLKTNFDRKGWIKYFRGRQE